MLAATLRTRLAAASARSLCTLPELVTTRSGLRYRDVGTNAEAPGAVHSSYATHGNGGNTSAGVAGKIKS